MEWKFPSGFKLLGLGFPDVIIMWEQIPLWPNLIQPGFFKLHQKKLQGANCNFLKLTSREKGNNFFSF